MKWRSSQSPRGFGALAGTRRTRLDPKRKWQLRCRCLRLSSECHSTLRQRPIRHLQRLPNPPRSLLHIRAPVATAARTAQAAPDDAANLATRAEPLSPVGRHVNTCRSHPCPTAWEAEATPRAALPIALSWGGDACYEPIANGTAVEGYPVTSSHSRSPWTVDVLGTCTRVSTI